MEGGYKNIQQGSNTSARDHKNTKGGEGEKGEEGEGEEGEEGPKITRTPSAKKVAL